MFVPNFDLYVNYEDSIKNFQGIAVFKKNNKTLIYNLDAHYKNLSFDRVDFCFSGKTLPIPEITVIELSKEQLLLKKQFLQQDNSVSYSAFLSTIKNIPFVCADLDKKQMLDILKKRLPNNNLIDEDVIKALNSGGPFTTKNIYNFYANEIVRYGRDPFMIKNIATALNKYNTVFASFGHGHYCCQRLILEDMLGEPEYIKEVPNTRGDFSDITLNPIDLGVEL